MENIEQAVQALAQIVKEHTGDERLDAVINTAAVLVAAQKVASEPVLAEPVTSQ